MPPVPTQFPDHEAIGVYGRKAEFQAALANDPIRKFREKLIANGVFSESDAGRVDEEARTEMDDAVRFALESPLPAPEEATNHVYA